MCYPCSSFLQSQRWTGYGEDGWWSWWLLTGRKREDEKEGKDKGEEEVNEDNGEEGRWEKRGKGEGAVAMVVILGCWRDRINFYDLYFNPEHFTWFIGTPLQNE